MPVLKIFSVYLVLVCPALVVSQDASVSSSETELPSHSGISTVSQTDFDDVTYISSDLNGRLELITEDITEGNKTVTEANIENNGPTETDQNSGENFQSAFPLRAADAAATKPLTDGFKSDDVINGSATSGTDVTITEGHGSEIPVTGGSFETSMNGESTTTDVFPEELNDQENLFTGPDLNNHELFELSSPTEESWFGEDFDDVGTYKLTIQDESSKGTEETVYATDFILSADMTSKGSTTETNIDQLDGNISTENVSNHNEKIEDSNNSEDDNKSEDSEYPTGQNEDIGTTTDAFTKIYDEDITNRKGLEGDDGLFELSSPTEESWFGEDFDDVGTYKPTIQDESSKGTEETVYPTDFTLSADITFKDDTTEAKINQFKENISTRNFSNDDEETKNNNFEDDNTSEVSENLTGRSEDIGITTDVFTKIYDEDTANRKEVEGDQGSSTKELEDIGSTDEISGEIGTNTKESQSVVTTNNFSSADAETEDIAGQNEVVHTTIATEALTDVYGEDSTGSKQADDDETFRSSTTELEDTKATVENMNEAENKNKEQDEEIATTSISFFDSLGDVYGQDTTSPRQLEDDVVTSLSTTKLEDTELTTQSIYSEDDANILGEPTISTEIDSLNQYKYNLQTSTPVDVDLTGPEQAVTEPTTTKRYEYSENTVFNSEGSSEESTTAEYYADPEGTSAYSNENYSIGDLESREYSSESYDQDSTTPKQVDGDDTELEVAESTTDAISSEDGVNILVSTEDRINNYQDEIQTSAPENVEITKPEQYITERTYATEEVMNKENSAEIYFKRSTPENIVSNEDITTEVILELEEDKEASEDITEQNEEIYATTMSYAPTNVYDENTTNLKQAEDDDVITLSTTDLEVIEATDDVTGDSENKPKESFIEEGGEIDNNGINVLVLDVDVSTKIYDEDTTNLKAGANNDEIGLSSNKLEDTAAIDEVDGETEDQEIYTTTISYFDVSTKIYNEDTTNLIQVEDFDNALSLSTIELEDGVATEEADAETEDKTKESFPEQDDSTTVGYFDVSTKIYDEDTTNLKQIEEDIVVNAPTTELEETAEVTGETEDNIEELFTDQSEEVDATTINYLDALRVIYEKGTTKQNDDAITTSELEDTKPIVEDISSEENINNLRSFTTEYYSEIDPLGISTSSKENDAIDGETADKTKESFLDQDEEIDTTTISYLDVSTKIYDKDTTNLKQVEEDFVVNSSTTEIEETAEITDETEDNTKELFTEQDVDTTTINYLDALTVIYEKYTTKQNDEAISSTTELEDTESTGAEISSENDVNNRSLTTEYYSEIDQRTSTYYKENGGVGDIDSEAYNTVSITTEYYENLDSTEGYSEENVSREGTDKNEAENTTDDFDNATDKAMNEEHLSSAGESIVSNEDIATDKTVLQSTDVVTEVIIETRNEDEKTDVAYTDIPTSRTDVDESALDDAETEDNTEMGVTFREGKGMDETDENETDELSTMMTENVDNISRLDDETEDFVDETTLYNYSEEEKVSTIDSVLETDTSSYEELMLETESTVKYTATQNEFEDSTDSIAPEVTEFSSTEISEGTTSEDPYSLSALSKFSAININTGHQLIEDLLNQLTNLIPDIENDTSLENLVENINITNDYNKILNNLQSYISSLGSTDNKTRAEQTTTEPGDNVEYFDATTIIVEQNNTTAVLDDIVPYVRWKVLQHEANISIKIVTRDSTLYVPSNASVFENAPNLTLNVTWQSPINSLNNSLSLALTQIGQYYLINDVQLILVKGDEIQVWKKNGVVIPKNSTGASRAFGFEVEDGIYVYFSDNDIFVLPDMDNHVVSGGQSTSPGMNRSHQVEIATGITGVLAMLTAIGYMLLRARKRAQQSKDISEYVAA